MLAIGGGGAGSAGVGDGIPTSPLGKILCLAHDHKLSIW